MVILLFREPNHQSIWYNFFEVEIVKVGRSGIQMSCLYVSLVAEEKKSLKRTFQQIQEEEDDDYPGSYSPQDPSAGPLLVCGTGWEWEFWKPPPVWYSHKVELPTSKMLLMEKFSWGLRSPWKKKWNRFFFRIEIVYNFWVISGSLNQGLSSTTTKESQRTARGTDHILNSF